MNREEDFLIQKFGKTQPFRVPDGYFDALTSNIMAALPADADSDGQLAEERAKVVPLKSRWRVVARVAAAACFCGVLLGVGSLFVNRADTDASLYVSAHSQQSAGASELDQMADYTMIDVGDMYAYVSDY